MTVLLDTTTIGCSTWSSRPHETVQYEPRDGSAPQASRNERPALTATDCSPVIRTVMFVMGVPVIDTPDHNHGFREAFDIARAASG